MNMYNYAITLKWSDQDHAWVALVPELPGCMADGETPEEAVSEVRKSIQDWIEEAQRVQYPVPVPLPSIDNIIKAGELLNKSELARLLGIGTRTLSARIARRTPLSEDESRRIQKVLSERGVCLI